MINPSVNNQNDFFFRISILLHLSLGFIMFLIRASETRFYNYIFFCLKKNNTRNNYISGSSQSVDENKKTQGEITEGFLDPDQPMTVMINKTLNLEFMCCVLYGFSTIFNKNETKRPKTEDSNLYMMNSSLTQQQKSINPNSQKKDVSKYFNV
jgi:hypothetical protein